MAPPELMFQTMERNFTSRDKKHAFLFVSWTNREKEAKDVVRTLPALVNHVTGELPSGWFDDKSADRIIKQVIYHVDEDGRWICTWHTEADKANKAMVHEMMPGMQEVQIAGLAAMLAEAEEARQGEIDERNTDGMSAGTSIAGSAVFRAELGVSRPSLAHITSPTPTQLETPPHTPQPTPQQAADVTQNSAQQSPGLEPVAVHGIADSPSRVGVAGQ